MSLRIEQDAGADCLHLDGDLTIYTIVDAKARLQGVPGAALDLSAVTVLDGAGLQLLMALHRDAGVGLVAVSDAVRDVMKVTGLKHLLPQS